MTEKTVLFVTGRLAEGSLRDVLQTVAPLAGFRFEITVPGIPAEPCSPPAEASMAPAVRCRPTL
ncbi:MAG: hypothetical protein ACKPHU_11215, partial [Planctomycetaceae bacterium]